MFLSKWSVKRPIAMTAFIIVLVLVSARKRRENQPPQSLGLSYFREER